MSSEFDELCALLDASKARIRIDWTQWKRPMSREMQMMLLPLLRARLLGVLAARARK